MSTISQTLRSAKELISTRERWTQNAMARLFRNGGLPVLANDPLATCWCSVGAVVKMSKTREIETSAIIELQRTIDCNFKLKSSVTGFNDLNAHSDVMRLFETTIERLEKQETDAVKSVQTEEPKQIG